MKNKFFKIFSLSFVLIISCILFCGCNYIFDVGKLKQPQQNVNTEFKKEKDVTGNYYLVKNSDNFKILNLADIHFGNGVLSKNQDAGVLSDVKNMINSTKPNLIILTGDNVFPQLISTGNNDNLGAYKVLAEFIESFQIPWTVIFGNYDNEIGTKHFSEDVCDYLESLKFCLFSRGNVSGYGNHIINIRNTSGNLVSSLFLFDSHIYKGSTQISGYDTIHDDQVSWYEENLNKFKVNNNNFTSFVYLHIPFTEYKEAWNLYRENSSEVEYCFGWANERNEKISCPKEKSSLFDKIVELKNTKGVFCGHNHLNDFSIKYKGVTLTYNSTMDNKAYVKADNEIRGATVLENKDNNDFNIYHKKLKDLN